MLMLAAERREGAALAKPGSSPLPSGVATLASIPRFGVPTAKCAQHLAAASIKVSALLMKKDNPRLLFLDGRYIPDSVGVTFYDRQPDDWSDGLHAQGCGDRVECAVGVFRGGNN